MRHSDWVDGRRWADAVIYGVREHELCHPEA